MSVDLRLLIADAGLTAKHLSSDGKFLQWSDSTITGVAKFKENAQAGFVIIDDKGIVTPAEGYSTFVNNQGIRVFAVANEFDANALKWDTVK